MGMGKSSVGRLVADQLHFTFLDTDDVIEARAGKPDQRHLRAGQARRHFASWERGMVEELALRTKTVISTGGGLPVEPGQSGQPQDPRAGGLPVGVAGNHLGARARTEPPAAAERTRSAGQNPRAARGARTLLPPGRRAGEHRDALPPGSRAAGDSPVSSRACRPTDERSHPATRARTGLRRLPVHHGRAARRRRALSGMARRPRRHGEMGYLERNAAKRAGPAAGAARGAKRHLPGRQLSDGDAPPASGIAGRRPALRPHRTRGTRA